MSGPLRLALIANPGAGGGTGREELVAALRAAGAEAEAIGLDALERVDATRHDRLVVAGGDGSIAPVAAAAVGAGLPLAVIPAGTANDFVRALALAPDVEGAVRLAASRSAAERTLDLARVDGRPFLNVASAGLPVPAARSARRLKGALGPLAYALGGVRAAARAAPVRAEVRVDGRLLYAGRAWHVIVAGSGAFGGGSDVEPADPADGLLDVVVITAGRRARLAVHAYGLRRGRIAGQRGVRRARARVASVALAGEAVMNVDGEVVPVGRPAGFTLQPGVLRLIVPPGSD